MNEDKFLVNKKVELVYINGFTLNGIIKSVNTYGVMLETTQKTSFISWANIREIVPC